VFPRCRPASSRTSGDHLVFEKQHGNPGFWTSNDDHVVWTVELPKAGRYAVWLDWACADNTAGKPYVPQTGTAELR
jgi:hypothetical protein